MRVVRRIGRGAFPGDTTAIAMGTVLRHELPALIVSHAESGTWLVADGVNDVDENDIHLLHLRHLTDHDPTLRTLARLPRGQQAARTAVGEPWIYEPFEWDPDEP